MFNEKFKEKLIKFNPPNQKVGLNLIKIPDYSNTDDKQLLPFKLALHTKLSFE